MKKEGNSLMKVTAAIAAVLITIALYFAKIPPFSLLETEPDAAESSESAPETTETPAAETTAPESGDGRLLVISLEPFDNVMKEDLKTQNMMKGEDSWARTLTIINPSSEPVAVYIFIQGVDPCPESEPKNCVRFPASVTVEPGGSQLIEIAFTQIVLTDDKPVEGKVVLAGGNVQQEFPFAITGEWQKTAFDYLFLGQWFLVALSGLIIWYILFLVLSLRILPALRPERFLPLRMDVTDDNESLWAAFSSRLIEMQDQGYGLNLTNPLAKDEGKIDLPTNLGKEGDFFKAVVDLLAWILPRRGLSIRIQSLKEDSKCKGISLSVVQNNSDQVLSEHLFWASEYGLGVNAGNIEYMLMTPAILWLSEWVRKKYPPKIMKQEAAWDVRASCLLADMLWSTDPASGKRLYMDALLREPANRQAQSGLGRIWVEESQKEDNTEHEVKDCLNFAVSFLANVCKGKPETLDPLWFAANYNMAVAHMYQNHAEYAADRIKVLFTEIDKLLSSSAKDSSTETLPGSAGQQDNGTFLAWLRRFKSMALVFKHSVILEAERPKDAADLDQKINAAISDLKSSIEITGDEASSSSGKANVSNKWLLVTLNYRAQYNAACYFSRCYRLSKNFGGNKEYATTALDYLRLALGHGGGLASLALKDQALRPLRDEFQDEFNDIAPKEKPKEPEKPAEYILRLVAEEPIIVQSKYQRKIVHSSGD